MIGSNEDDILMLEEHDENIFLNIRHTKDFRYITLNVFSDTHSKVLFIVYLICAPIIWSFVCCSCLFVLFQVYLINASDPLSQMTLVWEGESQVHCIVEHHRGHLYLFTDAAREGVPVDSHYVIQSVVESSGPNSWKVQIIHLLCYDDFFSWTPVLYIYKCSPFVATIQKHFSQKLYTFGEYIHDM